ncbi:MAG: glycosyltransferase family 2 protein [Anaerobutyricum hallii]
MVEKAINNELISVIVPIYNVDKYLEKCVNSILNQTYTNLEIILVDDGSPDRCPRICDNLAITDDRIKVIHQQNGGLSKARNVGIDVAKGVYLVFVDSDDTVGS